MDVVAWNLAHWECGVGLQWMGIKRSVRGRRTFVDWGGLVMPSGWMALIVEVLEGYLGAYRGVVGSGLAIVSRLGRGWLAV